MLRKIICMPNFDLPVKIDLESIRNELKQEAATEKSSATQLIEYDSDSDGKNPKAFNVLPLYSPPNNELKNQLSFQHNKYLACKFDRFLTEPKDSVQLRLYHEIKFAESMPKPRRMKLNGKFYDVDHKLAPAPYFPDPRQYCKKMSCQKTNLTK